MKGPKRQAAASKAQRYCIVISGRSPLDREIDEIAGAVRSIKQEIPIQICCSLGITSELQAKRLKVAGVDRVNDNLNTSEAFHASIVLPTPSRSPSTIRNAERQDGNLSRRGIVGMEEKDEDLIDLVMALIEVKAGLDSTEHAPSSGRYAARELRSTDSTTLLEECSASSRSAPVHPKPYRGGREHNLRSRLQPLARYPADSAPRTATRRDLASRSPTGA